MNFKLVLPPNEIYKLSTLPTTFAELKQIVQSKLGQEDISDFRLKYKDGEEELITLNSEDDFQTAVLTCEAESLKTLKVYVLENKVKTRRSSNTTQIIQSEGASASDSQTSSPRSFNSSCNYRYTLQVVGRKSTSPLSEKKKPSYKVQFRSKMRKGAMKVATQETYNYNLIVKNNGEEQWPAKVQLVCINGVHKGEVREIPSLKPAEKYEVKLSLNAPEKCGNFLSQWRLHYEEQRNLKGFGVTYFIAINTIKEKVNSEVSVCEEKSVMKQEKVFDSEPARGSNKQLKLAEMLNDMFPGALEEKIKFVESCPKDSNIYDLVDKYLLSLQNMQYPKKFFASQPVFA